MVDVVTYTLSAAIKLELVVSAETIIPSSLIVVMGLIALLGTSAYATLQESVTESPLLAGDELLA